MFKYLIESFRRKKARRVTQKYPVRIDTFPIPGIGKVEFGNWENPLVHPKKIDEGTLNFFKKFLKEGEMAIDIGANIGHMSVALSLITGKRGTVLAFDPNPFVYEILVRNAKLNQDKTHIIPLNYAISEQDEEFYYNSSEASFNNGGISKEKNNRHGKFSLPQKIKGVNLEQYLEKNYAEELNKFSLIKIDTEGYDKEIIRSIKGLLQKYRPVIFTECFGKNSDAEKYEQFELLKSLGYDLFYLSDFDEKAEIIPILKKEDMLRWGHFDLYGKVN